VVLLNGNPNSKICLAKVISCNKLEKFDHTHGKYVYNVEIKYFREGYANDASKINELLQLED